MATTAPGRLLSLDAIRGFAVMGILAMNIVAFGMPNFAYFDPTAYGMESQADLIAWAVSFVLIDSKMRGLFSILFGASTMLVIDGAVRSGRSAGRTHYARMVTLLLFGMVHFYLIWFGDILILYSACGMLLFLFRNLGIKALRNWGMGLIAAQTLLWSSLAGSLLVLQVAIAGGGMEGAELESAQAAISDFSEGFSGTPEKIEAELQAYGGSYADGFSYRLSEFGSLPWVGILQAGLETLGLMLLGAALFRSGMLTGAWDAARYRRWALVCFLIAVPALSLLCWWQIASNFDPILLFGSAIAFSLPFDVTLAIGWAALLLLWVKAAPDSGMIRRVAAAGRAAFSNYLGTSLLMTFVFYGYGLGLFGSVSRATLYLFVFGAWTLMLLWSLPWLTRYRYGPLEWLWRTMARGQLQPLRIRTG